MMKKVFEGILTRGTKSATQVNRSMMMMTTRRSMMTMQAAQSSTYKPAFFKFSRMGFSDGGPINDGPSATDTPADSTMADQPSYIKEMKSNRDWQDALENRERPVMIQAGAAWCGPCNILKPMLIDAVKAKEGKIEYLYVDIDEHQSIAQMLRIQHVPVVYLVRDGNLVDQFSGVPENTQKIEDFIEKGFVEMAPLKVDKLNEGEGPVVPKGSKVKVHYTGKLEDGTVFDCSVTRGDPIEFQVGVGQVIRGWDEGICQLTKGQKALLTCPPHYAYGAQGSGEVIPPNATLTFEVEVIDFSESE